MGNRYALPREARQILHRGVFADDVASARRAKLQPLSQLAGQPLALDGHNVLITLESALTGRVLVAADDGFIRDVAQLSGAYRDSPATRRALALLADYVSRSRPGLLTVLYDAPMQRSGELARETREIFPQPGASRRRPGQCRCRSGSSWTLPAPSPPATPTSSTLKKCSWTWPARLSGGSCQDAPNPFPCHPQHPRRTRKTVGSPACMKAATRNSKLKTRNSNKTLVKNGDFPYKI